MDVQSKKMQLVILGATAIICSRLLLFFLDDRQGPNLIIVGVLAMGVFLLSFAAYWFTAERGAYVRLLVALCVQILSVVGLFLWFLFVF